MNTDTEPTKGYYSIVQYVPDIERTEGANIGVVLFCPDQRFLQVKLESGNQRVRRFFGPDKNVEVDRRRIRVIKTAFQERIAFEGSRITTVEEFRKFIASRGNNLLLTEPRPIKVFDAEEEFLFLFKRLVGSRRVHGNQGEAEQIYRLKQQFETSIAKQGLLNLVERDVVLSLDVLGRTEKFPYSFRNGQLNVIKPVVFGGNERTNVNHACVLAMEGHNLAQNQVKLNVLASFQKDGVDHVRRTLQEMSVALRTDDQMDEFVSEIKRTAH